MKKNTLILIILALISLNGFSQIEKDSVQFMRYFSMKVKDRLKLLENKKSLGGNIDNVMLTDLSTLSGFDFRLVEDSIFILYSSEGILMLKSAKLFKELIIKAKDSLKNIKSPTKCGYNLTNRNESSNLYKTLFNYSRLCPKTRIEYLDSLIYKTTRSTNYYLVKLVKNDIDLILSKKTKELNSRSLKSSYKAIRSKWVKAPFARICNPCDLKTYIYNYISLEQIISPRKQRNPPTKYISYLLLP